MSWKRVAALSGVAAALLLIASFVIFLAQDPTGDPRIPDLANVGEIIPYIDAHSSSMKIQVLLNSVAVVLFLWFLGALWSRFHEVARDAARPRAVASAGGIVGAGALLAAMVFMATALILPVEGEGLLPLLYALSVISIGLGGAAFTVFFGAAAKVIIESGGLPKVLGYGAIVAAAAAAVGFVAVFADSGIFNAATGAIGYWARYAAFVLWIGLAGAALAMQSEAPKGRRR